MAEISGDITSTDPPSLPHVREKEGGSDESDIWTKIFQIALEITFWGSKSVFFHEIPLENRVLVIFFVPAPPALRFGPQKLGIFGRLWRQKKVFYP